MIATSSADGAKPHANTETHQRLPVRVCSNAIMRKTQSVQNKSTACLFWAQKSSEDKRRVGMNVKGMECDSLNYGGYKTHTTNQKEMTLITENTEHNTEHQFNSQNLPKTCFTPNHHSFSLFSWQLHTFPPTLSSLLKCEKTLL